MHLYGYKLVEWWQAVLPGYSFIIGLMQLHNLALKYDLPQLAKDASQVFDHRLDILLGSKSPSSSNFNAGRIVEIATVLYRTSGDERSSLPPGFLQLMRTNWANLMEFRKYAITSIFDKYPRLAVDLLMNDPEHIHGFEALLGARGV